MFSFFQNAKELSELKESRSQLDSDLQCAYTELRQSHKNENDKEILESKLKEYAGKRISRQSRFVELLEEKRQNQLHEWMKGNVS